MEYIDLTIALDELARPYTEPEQIRVIIKAGMGCILGRTNF